MDIDGVEHVCSDADMEIEYGYLKEKCDAGADVIITQASRATEQLGQTLRSEDRSPRLASSRPGLPSPLPPPPQLFYDMRVFETFVRECRSRGINAPILPGIMPLNAYGGFKRMTGAPRAGLPHGPAGCAPHGAGLRVISLLGAQASARRASRPRWRRWSTS